MFEYAVCPVYEEGILLDYGICDEDDLNYLFACAGLGGMVTVDGVMRFSSDNDDENPLLNIFFRPASPDCTTGK